MNTKKNNGFSIIELLIAMVVVGLLIAVVTANVGAAQKKADDAKIKTNLAIIQSKAELFYETNKSYGAEAITCSGMFSSDAGIANALAAAQSASGGAANVVCVLSDDTTAVTSVSKTWAMSVRLKSDPTAYWCVDSQIPPSSKQTNTPVVTTGVTSSDGAAGIAKCP